ncbi:hypothetical protein IWQ60_002671 [Tieghemiomyces parasiticus]|uniref:BLOC-1-related complex subunit 6 C-terminal helix domain-containing protein n=1 Tax=Tieghemiomyces parasiticus TaxID=78921 RepID=A0A9W8DVH4_9FUNG|nr:hypothetical protein IWQ60_002671 [Tieghemiomyces parasiticus]
MTIVPHEVAFSRHIDPEVLDDLEHQTSNLASELDLYIQSLQMQVEQCFDVALQTLDVNEEAAGKVAGAVQESIGKTTQLIRLCDQLDRDMEELNPIQQQL